MTIPYSSKINQNVNKVVSSIELTTNAGLFEDTDNYILGSGTSGGTQNGIWTAIHDPLSIFNNSSASWTIPRTGMYQINLFFLIAIATISNYDPLQLSIKFSVEKNGVAVTDFAFFCNYPGNSSSAMDVLRLEAGDTISRRVGNSFVNGTIIATNPSGKFTFASLVEI